MILVRGLSFEIISVRLRNARFEVTAERPGPVPALEYEEVAIFGEDGLGILMGGMLVGEKGAKEGQFMRVVVTFQVRSAENVFLT